MKKETKRLYENKASKFLKRIQASYMLLDANNSDFFNQYHDTLRIQMDCSFEVALEMDFYLIEDNLESFNTALEQLKSTAAYCEAVIKLQKQTVSLPEPIFG